MAHAASPSVVWQLGALYTGGTAAGFSDRQLLERFSARRDAVGEAAFAALVARHGPMVLGVCRQLLGDRHHAEDAFQAVFLVLARKARSVREPELLGNWLYGVALRTARKARGRLARRRETEEEASNGGPATDVAAIAEQALVERERAEALHREIDRLPGAFRAAVVLCYFEGLSPDEAAQRLRWPAGTLRSRLVRAREKLRRGLTLRGVALPAAALAAALAPRSVAASVSARLCDTNARAATAFAARNAASGMLSASAAATAREVLHAMLFQKLKLAGLSLLHLAAVATGVAFLTRLPAIGDERMKTPLVPAASAAPRDADRPQPAGKAEESDPGRMTVTGRVLDPEGRPAAGVPVDIIAASRAPEAGIDVERGVYVLLGQGSADGDGRFRIEAARAGSAQFHDVCVVAAGAGRGSGFGSVKLAQDAEQPAAEIHLQPEQVIRGRLVDLSGQPAAGIEVRLSGVYRASPVAGGGIFDSLGFGRSYVWSGSPEGLRAWPKDVRTDAQGRFVLAGIGRDLSVSLSFRGERFAQQKYDVAAGDRDATKEVSLALHPARIIEGRVLAAETGQPVSGAVISVRASFGAWGGMFTTKFRADERGHFKINPYAGDYFRMRAFPPEGQPYLARESEFEWTKGAVSKTIDLTLPRGVLIRGKVAEEGTRRPVAGASVQFFPRNRSGDFVHGFEAIVASKDDGWFAVAVPPGKGYLMVLGPSLNYIPSAIGGGELYGSGQRGGGRFYAHDAIAYEVKAGDGVREITATLRPGRTIRGGVLGPEGQVVDDAVALTRQQIDPINLTLQSHGFVHAREGRFELHGFDPEKAVPVYFLDALHAWGAVVELSGKQAGEEMTVRLQPCGQARARFVGPDGKPLANLVLWPYLELLMTPGATAGITVDTGENLQADGVFLPNVDPRHYGRDLVTDADGRATVPALIPGAPYRIIDWSTRNVEGKGVQLRKDFRVKPGETLDLGDILVESPET